MTKEANKLQINVFVPLSACGCNYTKFMDRMFAELIPYKESLDVQVKDIQGLEANSYVLFNNSVVIPDPPNQDKPLICTSYLELRKYLKDIFSK